MTFIDGIITVFSGVLQVFAAPFTWWGFWGGIGCYAVIFLLGFLKRGGK